MRIRGVEQFRPSACLAGVCFVLALAGVLGVLSPRVMCWVLGYVLVVLTSL